MKNLITLITASIFTAGIAISSASAFQAAPESAEKAKEMMEKTADKGMEKHTHEAKDADAKMGEEHKKMEGMEKDKMKEMPPSNF